MNAVLHIGSNKILFALSEQQAGAISKGFSFGPAMLIIKLPGPSLGPHKLELQTLQKRVTVNGPDGDPIVEILFASTLTQASPRLAELLKRPSS